MNIELVAAAEFAKSEARNYLSYGIIFGILIAMAFYGFFLFVSLKYRSYLYFILYTVSVGLWLFYVQGFAKVLFGQMPGFDQAMLWFWAGMFITWGTIFTISFLELQKTSRFLFYILAAALGKATQHAALVEMSLSFSCPAFQRTRHFMLQSESASISKPRACAL